MHTLGPICAGGDRRKVSNPCVTEPGPPSISPCNSFRVTKLKAGQMGTKLRKLTLAVLLAGSAAVLVAPPAEANRGNGTTTTTEPAYVPPYGQVQPELPDEPNPYENPVVAPTVVQVDLPAITDPNAGLAGEGDRLGPAPSDAPATVEGSQTRPQPANDGGFGGILSRTGAETLPLARAGVAILALGIGLVVLARRRRVEVASA